MGIGALFYMAYVIWEDWEYSLTWFGSAWRLIVIPPPCLVFFLVLGFLWQKFIHLDSYYDLAILAGPWAVGAIGVFIWIFYIGRKFPDNPDRAMILQFMVEQPALEPAKKALDRGDDEEAIEKLKSLPDGGNPAAQHNLGIMYRHSPDDIQNRGNRTTVPPPRERHPFGSHPMVWF